MYSELSLTKIWPLPKTNTAPQKQWVSRLLPFWDGPFSVCMFYYQGRWSSLSTLGWPPLDFCFHAIGYQVQPDRYHATLSLARGPTNRRPYGREWLSTPWFVEKALRPVVSLRKTNMNLKLPWRCINCSHPSFRSSQPSTRSSWAIPSVPLRPMKLFNIWPLCPGCWGLSTWAGKVRGCPSFYVRNGPKRVDSTGWRVEHICHTVDPYTSYKLSYKPL